MNSEVENYINNQKQPQAEISLELRTLILETFPEIIEEMKWGVPTYGNGKCYIVSLKNHVNFGFSLNNFSKEEIAIYEGSGKTMKHIKIRSLEEINKPLIIELLKRVMG